MRAARVMEKPGELATLLPMDRERSRSDDENTYWQAQKGGGFVLHVDGRPRGIVTPGMNGVILSKDGAPGHKFTAPNSHAIFDEVERRAGVGRVKQFRTSEGTTTIIPWRAMEERRAAACRSEVPPEREAEHHADTAFELLNEKAVSGGLSNRANEARLHLGKALHAVEKNNGRWSDQARAHLTAARDLLRGEKPQEPPAWVADVRELTDAPQHCEKAVAAAERDRREERKEAEKLPLSERIRREREAYEARERDEGGRERD